MNCTYVLYEWHLMFGQELPDRDRDVLLSVRISLCLSTAPSVHPLISPQWRQNAKTFWSDGTLISRILSSISRLMPVDGLPNRWSSSTDSRPSLKYLNLSKTLDFLNTSSTNPPINIYWISVPLPAELCDMIGSGITFKFLEHLDVTWKTLGNVSNGRKKNRNKLRYWKRKK